MGVSENEKLVIFLTEGMKVLNLKSKIEFERESETELWISLPDLGVSVFCDSEGATRQSIGRKITIPEYQVYTMSHLPATREQPEDTDLVIRGTFDRIDSVVAEVFALVVKDTIFDMIEAVGLRAEALVEGLRSSLEAGTG